MEKATWTVTLADGSVIENLTLNGNNFVSNTEITEEMFNGKLSEVHFAHDGEERGYCYPEVIKNAELVQIAHYADGWYFILRETPAEKLFRAKLEQTQLDTDEMIASQEERIIMLELGLTLEV